MTEKAKGIRAPYLFQLLSLRESPPPGISREHSPTTFLGFRPSLPTNGSLRQGACLTLTIFCRGSYKPCQMVQIRDNQSPKTVRSLKGLLVCGHTLSFPLSLSSSYLLCTRHSLVPASHVSNPGHMDISRSLLALQACRPVDSWPTFDVSYTGSSPQERQVANSSTVC